MWVGERYFSFSRKSRLALWPIQPTIQWVPGLFSGGAKIPGVKLTTNLHPVLRLRMSVPIPPPPLHISMVQTGNTLLLPSWL